MAEYRSDSCPVILLVEDDLGDQELTRRALEDGNIENCLKIVQDGEEALDYLYHRGKYESSESAPRPNLVLLDLNMPKVDGRQVLEIMRGDHDLRRLPVVVFTTSDNEEDVLKSYDLGVNSYITKPSDVDDLARLVQALQAYWFKVVVLPPH